MLGIQEKRATIFKAITHIAAIINENPQIVGVRTMEPMNEEEVRLRPWRIVTREVFGDRSMRELQEVRETLDVMISEMGADTYQDTITMNATRVDPTVASTSANASNATAHDQQSPDVGTTPATEVCGLPITCGNYGL